MLDSWHMNLIGCKRGIGGCRAGFACNRHVLRVCKIQMIGCLIWCLILITSFASSLYGQQQSQGGVSQGTQSGNALDCADPLQASSSDCTGQNLGDTNSLRGTQIPPVAPGNGAAQQRNPNHSYSD